jgi:lipid II:glycine glycyltransferase (peptidoglycan interpeptide bridge formation enzyme)
VTETGQPLRVVRRLTPTAWASFVDEQPRATIFHTPEMHRVFAATRGHRPRLFASVGDDGRLVAMLTVVDVTTMPGPLRYVSTRAVAYGSVLAGTAGDASGGVDLALGAYGRALRPAPLFTEMRNLHDIGDLRPVLAGHGFVHEPHLNYLIDLTVPEASLWSAIRPAARRNIQKARRRDVVIGEVADPTGIPPVYDVLGAVYQRLRVPLPDISLLEAAHRILYPKGMLRLLTATVDGRTVGALALLRFRDTAYYWYTGTLREYASYRTSDLLVWHALQLGVELGCRTFDFGGAGTPGEEYGVRDFKAKFGGRLVDFGREVRVHSSARLRLARLGYELTRRFL